MLEIGFVLMNHQIAKCIESGVVYMCLSCICTYARITYAMFVKPRKPSEALKFTVSVRLALSERVDAKYKLTIIPRSLQSTNSPVQFVETTLSNAWKKFSAAAFPQCLWVLPAAGA